jgi:galactose mutarotase-like enzyme
MPPLSPNPMTTLTIADRQYKTYILTDEATQTRVEVVPERGGIITRWQIGEEDMLYLDTDRFTDPALSVRGGIPILFPICGNLPDNTYIHEGKTYSLKQHGFARELPWTVVDSPADGVRLSLTSNDTTRAVYPFDFEVIYTYRLQGNDLLIEQRYVNRSPVPLPFSAGFHPYFSVADKSQLQLDIPAREFQTKNSLTPQPFSGSFDYGEDEIDVAFQAGAERASVIDQGRSRQLTLSYDPMFTTLVFWTVKGKDFYCLEPWSAPRNAMNTGEDLTLLQPGGAIDTWVKLSVQPL